MAMQIILTQDVPNLGSAGELVSVKPGYGRNYLVPRGLAVTRHRRQRPQARARQARHRQEGGQGAAKRRVARREDQRMTLQFDRQVGEDDKLFGSVTSRDIAES
jgi:large subunit ribosomal protein L9